MTDPTVQAQQLTAHGVGLALDDGDLVLESGRPATVSGLANLSQALRLRILTPWGTDPLNAGYGLDIRDAFTTGLPRGGVKAVLRLNLVRTVASDARVAQIRAVMFDDDPEYLAAHPGAPAPTAASRAARTAVVEILYDPIPLPSGSTASGTIAAMATSPTTASVLANLSW